MNYCTVSDIIELWRPLKETEITQATQLIETVSSEIRLKAKALGKDFDSMASADTDLANVAKSVTVDVVKRYVIDTANDSPSMSQMSQSAGGYSVSGTFLVPGGGVFLKKSELARLGLRRQRMGVIDLCG